MLRLPVLEFGHVTSLFSSLCCIILFEQETHHTQVQTVDVTAVLLSVCCLLFISTREELIGTANRC